MMVDIQTVSVAIASAGVFLAAIYYILQIRHQAKMRQTDLVMKLYSELGSKEYLEAYPNFFTLEFKDYKDFQNRYPKGMSIDAPAAFVSYMMHCYFFEGVGILLHRKLIDIELVDDLFTIAIKQNWEKVKPIVEGTRQKWGWPQYWEWFEYLYNEMKKREQRLQQKGVKNG
jgi:hypothetical protein